MPPSGYSLQQTDSLRDFLRSCSRDLQREAIENGCTYQERLEKEIADIAGFLRDNSDLTSAQSAVLRLTSDFYSGVSRSRPSDLAEFDAAVQQTLSEIARGVLAIHIENSSFIRPRTQKIAAE